jgi:hypothetical protein
MDFAGVDFEISIAQGYDAAEAFLDGFELKQHA